MSIEKTLVEILDRSRIEDSGKSIVSTARKSIALKTQTANDGSQTPCIEMIDTTNQSVTTAFFSRFSWKQLWQRILDYPLSGVERSKLSLPLVESISKERIERIRNTSLEAKLRIVDSQLLLRGLIHPRRTSLPTSSFLESVSIGASYHNVICHVQPFFHEEVFVGYFRIEHDQEDDDTPRIGFTVINSEVGAAKTVIDAFIALPKFGSTMIIRNIGRPAFLLGRHHKTEGSIIKDVTNAVDEIEKNRTNFCELVKKNNSIQLSSKDGTLARMVTRFGASRESMDATQREFDSLTQQGIIQPTKLAMAIAISRIAARKPVLTRYNLEGIAGQILQLGV